MSPGVAPLIACTAYVCGPCGRGCVVEAVRRCVAQRLQRRAVAVDLPTRDGERDRRLPGRGGAARSSAKRRRRSAALVDARRHDDDRRRERRGRVPRLVGRPDDVLVGTGRERARVGPGRHHRRRDESPVAGDRCRSHRRASAQESVGLPATGDCAVITGTAGRDVVDRDRDRRLGRVPGDRSTAVARSVYVWPLVASATVFQVSGGATAFVSADDLDREETDARSAVGGAGLNLHGAPDDRARDRVGDLDRRAPRCRRMTCVVALASGAGSA